MSWNQVFGLYFTIRSEGNSKKKVSTPGDHFPKNAHYSGDEMGDAIQTPASSLAIPDYAVPLMSIQR